VSFTYRNRDTGEEVTFEARSPRLDALAYRWELAERPAAAEPDEDEGDEPAPARPARRKPRPAA
jgi:hypothetical protein